MKKEVIIKQNVILITGRDEFAVLDRNMRENGLQQIVFSSRITPIHADYLEKSGIVEVHSFKESGIISFKRKDFYETHLMIELVADIIEKI